MQRVEWLKTDLQKPVGVLELKTDLFLHDDTGNMIGIEVTDGGETATLTGTARCYVIRPDTTTVIFEAVVEGNKVYAILPKEVYYFTGRANFLVRMETEGNSMTLCAFTAIVYRDRTDRISDEEHIIPSIEEIIAAIEEMQEVIDEALVKLDDMTASASSLPTGSMPTAVMTLADGHYHIAFGIPKSDGDVINDNTGAGDYNLTWSADKLSKLVNSTQIVEAVISTGSWSSATHPTQTISVLGVKSDNNIAVYPSTSVTKTELDALGFANILCTGQATDSITVTCFGHVPQVNIPISVMILGAEIEGTDITVDTTISPISTNPVQNKVIKRELDNKADVIEVTVENQAIATFNDGADDLPMKELKVAIDPVQDLNGQEYPYPPGAGKNLFDADGNVFMVGQMYDENGNIVENALVKTSDFIAIQPNTQYTISGTDMHKSGSTTQVGLRMNFFDSSKGFLSRTDATASGNVKTATSPATAAFVRFGCGSNAVATSIQFELGSSATDYAPYSNVCPISGWTGANIRQKNANLLPNTSSTSEGYVNNAYLTASGNTSTNNAWRVTEYFRVPPDKDIVWSFGGSAANAPSICFYDRYKRFISGKNAGNKTAITVHTPENAYYARASIKSSGGGGNNMVEIGDVKTEFVSRITNDYSIAFVDGSGDPLTVYGGTLTVNKDGTGILVVDSEMIASYNGETLPGEWISDRDVYESGTTPTIGAQVVYKLATPSDPIQFSATQVRTLLGVNNIYVDTGDIISATYPADTKLYIDGKIAELLNNNG